MATDRTIAMYMHRTRKCYLISISLSAAWTWMDGWIACWLDRCARTHLQNDIGLYDNVTSRIDTYRYMVQS